MSYCQDGDVEFDDDTPVLFRIFKRIEVFKPNRYVGFGDSLQYNHAELCHVCLCTAQVYCKKCSHPMTIYFYKLFIDQMQEIIDHLKTKEIDISMPRPRDLIYSHRELIIYFRIQDEGSCKYYEDIDKDDEENEVNEELKYELELLGYIVDKPLEYTLEATHIPSSVSMTPKDSFLTRCLDHTYTRRYIEL